MRGESATTLRKLKAVGPGVDIGHGGDGVVTAILAGLGEPRVGVCGGGQR
jgi:hypothetical protein